MWVLEDILSGVEGLSMAVFTRTLGWSKEETDIFLVDVRKDMKNTRYHSYYNMYVTLLFMVLLLKLICRYVVYAQKPL
jgi:hypothetical protein